VLRIIHNREFQLYTEVLRVIHNNEFLLYRTVKDYSQ
jgi:hypothetical protein